jgi:hypothetical protein
MAVHVTLASTALGLIAALIAGNHRIIDVTATNRVVEPIHSGGKRRAGIT